ncbi:hypothetical protein RJ639_005158 [Escallonia herrerae]|uniref:DNA-directed RNA polymerase n=1 Tax=Escallonia herrerae TaxID=1293975 RepID=A0AA88W4Z3_9ASTE|nr:hypothetical protein RJ639_005158 [Escallonia herrerae]
MVANEDDAVGPHPQQSYVRGLVKQHLDSFNYFVTTGIKKIVRANDYIESKIDPKIYLRYTDVWIGKPSIGSGSDVRGVNPHECRLSETTYAAPICVNIVYSNGSHGQLPVMKREKAIIGRMPIMLRSCRCVLYEKDEEELARRGECPLDPGGYFVMKGTEKVHENNFRSKCIYVAVMLRRMMEAILNKDAVDDKDLFKTMNDEIRRGVDIILAKPSRSSRFDISQREPPNGVMSPINERKENEFGSQVVARLSFTGTLGHMTKICPQFEKSRKCSRYSNSRYSNIASGSVGDNGDAMVVEDSLAIEVVLGGLVMVVLALFIIMDT